MDAEQEKVFVNRKRKYDTKHKKSINRGFCSFLIKKNAEYINGTHKRRARGALVTEPASVSVVSRRRWFCDVSRRHNEIFSFNV